jgi:hypothetical protein
MQFKKTIIVQAEPMPVNATAGATIPATITTLIGATPVSYEVAEVALGYYFDGVSDLTVDITVGEDTTTYAVALWGQWLVKEPDGDVHVYSIEQFRRDFPESVSR